MRRRGRGARFTTADCPECGEMCDADDTNPDAHRMWAKRHANRTGHTALVETVAVRSYAPTSDGAGETRAGR